MVKFGNISDVKRQPGVKGFPVPMAKQMSQPKRKLKFPSPNPPADEREIRRRVKKAHGHEERPRYI